MHINWLNHDGKYSCKITRHITSIIDEEKEKTKRKEKMWDLPSQKRTEKVRWDFEGSACEAHMKLVWWLKGGI